MRYRLTSEKAREAGRKGGAIRAENRLEMSRIGKLGVVARRAKREAAKRAEREAWDREQTGGGAGADYAGLGQPMVETDR